MLYPVFLLVLFVTDLIHNVQSSLRFFEGKTQTEVAEEIHISQAQVSRLEKGALDWIKQILFKRSAKPMPAL